ncbi:threonine-phosphate decarboxylase CobD [Paenibacillus tarimensis]
MLERFGHGGDLLTAAEAYGGSADRFLDFSSNMNPFGPPSVVRDTIEAYAARIHVYPDPAVRELRQALAFKHRVSEESILVGNGAAELIDLAVRDLKPQRVGLFVPCFTEYGDAALKAGASVVTVPLDAERSFEVEAADAERFPEAPPVLIIGSPNNPTGVRVRPEHVLEWLKQGITVVVDEAFLDFSPDADRISLVSEAANSDRLLVIRSMTKFYAIPGIRLGYIVAHPRRIASLRALQVPWSVNSLAQKIGCAVMNDRAYEQRTVDWLQGERPWLTGRLREIGLHVNESDANYLLVSLPEHSKRRVSSLQREMGERGILLRDASLFEGLDDGWFRIAIRLRQENERLLEALGDVLGSETIVMDSEDKR